MVLESLTSAKFKPLSRDSQRQVRGGGTTGAGSRYLRTEWSDEWTTNPDGTKRHKYRTVYMTWGSDAEDGRDTCYYDTGESISEWM